MNAARNSASAGSRALSADCAISRVQREIPRKGSRTRTAARVDTDRGARPSTQPWCDAPDSAQVGQVTDEDLRDGAVHDGVTVVVTRPDHHRPSDGSPSVSQPIHSTSIL